MKEQIDRRATSIARNIERFSYVVGNSPELNSIIDSVATEQDVEMIAVFQRDPFQLVTNDGKKLTIHELEQAINEKYPGQGRVEALRTKKSFNLVSAEKGQADYVLITPIALKEPDSNKSIDGIIYISFEIQNFLEQIYPYRVKC